MITHNLTSTVPTSDSQLLIATGAFCLLMIVLSIMGLLAERRRFRNLLAIETADEQQALALAAPYTPDFTAEQIRTAADTNSRRAIARDSQKGTTHE